MKILIIIPAYNEEGNLPALLDELRFLDIDAIVINDSSKDRTSELAEIAGFKVITLPINLGIGGAVQTGFIYAVRNGYDIVVQLDGDGQHDPKHLNDVIAPIIAKAADCVIGSRYIPEMSDRTYRTTFIRRIGMLFSSLILRIATGLMIYDTTSGYRALSKEAFTYFSQYYPVDHPEAEALFLLHQNGFRLKEVPISMRRRMSGESLFTFVKIALYPMRVIIGFIGLIFTNPRRRHK